MVTMWILDSIRIEIIQRFYSVLILTYFVIHDQLYLIHQSEIRLHFRQFKFRIEF